MIKKDALKKQNVRVYPCKCLTKLCRGKATKSGNSPYCSKCRMRRWRSAYPIKAHYSDLKHRAGQRGHQFDITLEEFTHFWNTSGYAEGHGKTKDSLSIDRINPNLGYSLSNIKVLTLSDNSIRQRNPYHGLTPREIAIVRVELKKMRESKAGAPSPDPDPF